MSAMDRREFLWTTAAGASLLARPGGSGAGWPDESPAERDRRMAWWREARFGMFIHWGIYSTLGGVWKGEQVKLQPAEWTMQAKHVPDAEYSQIAANFNPVKFNAREWAALAKRAGMKYLVITSKHHDGFCLFDSKLTNYDIMDATPFQRDVIKELAEACAAEGIRFGVYYSQLDWHFAEKPVARATIPNFDRYLEYMKGQLEELLTGYGPFGSLFFDGDWMPQWNNVLGREIEAWCRRFQPHLVINDRLSKRPTSIQLAALLKLPYRVPVPPVGDYATPEQSIPGYLPPCDWESNMTMNTSWGYKSFDNNWKSTADLIRKLVDIASKGGNFLLNVGPTGEGVIPQPSVERLEAIGKWMQVNGEAIYGTGAGPLQNLKWGRSTQKAGNIYLHVFDWPAGELKIKGLKQNVRRAYLLADAKADLPVSQAGGATTIKLPEIAPDPISSAVVLEGR